MRAPLPSPRRIAVGAGLAVLAAGLTPIAAAPANPASTGLVISEVYGGGGNAGAILNADFVELYNPTAGADQRWPASPSSTAPPAAPGTARASP